MALHALLLAGALSTAGSWLVQVDEPQEACERFLALLVEAEGVDDETLSARLLELGPALLEPALEVLGTGRLPDPPDPETRELGASLENAVVHALGRLDRGALLAHLESGIKREPTLALRCAALRVLEEYGGLERLPTLLRAATPPEDEAATERLIDRFEAALRALVERDTATLDTLRRSWYRIDDRLAPHVLQAVGGSEARGVVEFLTFILNWEPGHEAVAIAQLAKHVESAAGRDEDVVELLRDQLDDDRSTIIQASALALGSLEDTLSVPRLIELLSAEHRGVRENSEWALRRITGLSLAGAAAWEPWYEAELDWLDRRGDRALEGLTSERREVVVESLRQITRHPVLRHELEWDLIPILEHESASVRALACHAIELMRSRGALEDLLYLLLDESAQVKERSLSALRRITGHDLPLDFDAWNDALLADGTLSG